ncbi:hypothetical protein [Bradyrhizobium jicamae]|nr:hypothetical protein [Bradyrhizobium jicamae]MBR0934249.1 hypothetical protein [Bradyrhizobium jicamae]
MKTIFSIYEAADLLERDRTTLVRALRHTTPDGHTAANTAIPVGPVER